MGGRKTCRDKRTFSHCPSAPEKVLRSGWVAVLRAETFTGDHQPWGQPCTPGGTWSSARGWGPSALPCPQCLAPASTAATSGGATGGHDPTSDRMALEWEDRDAGTHTFSLPKTGSDHTLPLPGCHVRVSAAWEQSLHSQSVLEPSANKSIARSLETHFPVFYLGLPLSLHLCEWCKFILY